MLFDLRGRGRRRTVQVIYVGLALIFVLGFVGLGVGGGFGGGGIFSAFTEREGSSGTSHSSEIKKYEQLTKRQPGSAVAWEKLVQAQLHEAGGEAYTSRTGGVTSKGKQLYGQIASSWNRYLALNPPNPSVPLAKAVLLVFGDEGLNQPAQAAQVLQIIVAAEPNSTHYYSFLAAYAYRAHNVRVGDLAAAKAVSLAPAAQRARLKNELAQLKKNPSGAETATATTNGQTFKVKSAGGGTYTGTVPQPPPSGSSPAKKK